MQPTFENFSKRILGNADTSTEEPSNKSQNKKYAEVILQLKLEPFLIAFNLNNHLNVLFASLQGGKEWEHTVSRIQLSGAGTW